jgi:hypothetical protein
MKWLPPDFSDNFGYEWIEHMDDDELIKTLKNGEMLMKEGNLIVLELLERFVKGKKIVKYE